MATVATKWLVLVMSPDDPSTEMKAAPQEPDWIRILVLSSIIPGLTF